MATRTDAVSPNLDTNSQPWINIDWKKVEAVRSSSKTKRFCFGFLVVATLLVAVYAALSARHDVYTFLTQHLNGITHIDPYPFGAAVIMNLLPFVLIALMSFVNNVPGHKSAPELAFDIIVSVAIAFVFYYVAYNVAYYFSLKDFVAMRLADPAVYLTSKPIYQQQVMFGDYAMHSTIALMISYIAARYFWVVGAEVAKDNAK
jgi:hypothetical protein